MKVLRGLRLLIVLNLIIVGMGDGQMPENFHTAACFVKGCYTSIMINQTEAERFAQENHSLRPFCFNIIIKTNQAVEAACPGIVSCADKLAIAARDATVLVATGPFNVELDAAMARTPIDLTFPRVSQILPLISPNLTPISPEKTLHNST